MTTAKKDEVSTKTPAAPTPKKDPIAPDINSDQKAATAPVAAPVPPLVQADNTRKALDGAMKGKIIEMLSQPGANATSVSNATGVSYNTVLSIKQGLAGGKTNKPTRAASVSRAVPQKPVQTTASRPGIDELDLLQLEVEYLRKKVALLEARAAK